ncbi:MAG: sporulation protein YqfD [Bacilli bacterium]|nr:sporulation protein YqfD [Bacilli bacterium]
MKNSFIYRFKNKTKLIIRGKNIERFVRRLIKNKIEIIDLKQIKYNEISIIVYTKDIEKIEKIKTIYEIEIKRNYGLNRIYELIKINKYLILFILFGIFLIYLLSNIIFDVEVVHNDSYIRKFLKEELKKYNIDKYKLKKDYKTKEKIKKDLLNKYKDKLEWIEIEEKGTKYIIRVEERIINKTNEKNINRNIIAKKNGIIISIDAKDGVIVKNKNDYVKKGDIIIDGNIYLNEEIKKSVSATGTVYAEVWYVVNIEIPYHYKEIKLTKNKQKVYTIKFLNKYYDLFNMKKYKTKIIKNNYLIKNNLLPLSFIEQKQYETIEIDEIYTKEKVVEKAIEQSKQKLLKKLKEDSEILNYRILDEKSDKEKLKLKIFFSVKEDITDYQKIEELKTE